MRLGLGLKVWTLANKRSELVESKIRKLTPRGYLEEERYEGDKLGFPGI